MFHPWDRKEPIIDAITRHGLLEYYNQFIAIGDAHEIAHVMELAGVDRKTAAQAAEALVRFNNRPQM